LYFAIVMKNWKLNQEMILPMLKGTVSRDFLLLVFFMNDTGGKFATGVNDTGGKFANGVNDAGGNLPPVSTTPAANLPPVSLTPWQIMATISGCRHLKVNLKAKIYIHVYSTTQRCPNKIIKIFLLEGISICHRCR
jgi:hypothetical protein